MYTPFNTTQTYRFIIKYSDGAEAFCLNLYTELLQIQVHIRDTEEKFGEDQ